MRLEGQVTSISGVSHAGQVGYALASAFAHEGALLAISARNVERVNVRSVSHNMVALPTRCATRS